MNGTFSRSQFPPGGWQFFQPQTGWSPQTPKSSTFDQTVQQIIKHRLANGAITAKHNLSVDVAAVGNELENFTRARIGMPTLEQLTAPKTTAPRQLPQGVRDHVAAASKMAEGVALLIDWLPAGQTVEPHLAEKRAGICKDCPKNSQAAFASWFTVPVAERLKKMVEARKDMHLETSHDPLLGVCAVCLCPMKLKVHVPLEYILGHTKPTTLAEFPPPCWIANRDQ